jgi:hypothetical protein
MFELPLFSGFFAGLKKAQAVRRGVRDSEWLSSTGGDSFGEGVRLLPEAGSWKEAVLETGARGLLQVEIREVELHCCARVFVGEIDAGDALVVGGESDGNASGSVGRQRMPWCGDAEDDIIRSEVDLDHDVTVCHLLQQSLRFVFIHDIDAVTDAFGVAEINGLTDVKTKTIGGDKARGDLTRVKGDVNLWVDTVKVVEHKHLAVILGHGQVGIFGLHEINTDDARVYRSDLKGKQSLCEDMLRGKGSKDLIEKTDFDGTGRSSTGLAAVLDAVASVKGIVQLLAIHSDLVSKTCLEESVAKVAEVFVGSASSIPGAVFCWIDGGRGPLNVGDDLREVGEDRCLHDLKVLLILRCSAGGDFVEPLCRMGLMETAEAIEGSEELIVSADAGAGNEGAHGEGIDESVVELLVFESVLGTKIAFTTDGLGRDASGGGVWFKEAVRGGIDTEKIGGAVLDEGLSIDRASEMHVQICALRHTSEKGVELEWALLCSVESFDGALLARRGGSGCCPRSSWCRQWCRNLCVGDANETEKKRCGCKASVTAEHGRPSI